MADLRSYTLATIGTTRAGSSTMRGRLMGGVKVLGVPKAIAKLKAADSIVRREVGLVAYQSAQVVVKRAKELAPVDTGYLRRSIHAEKQGPYNWRIVADTSATGADYAGYQEFGWTDRGGNWHPGANNGAGYMRPAISAGRERVNLGLARLKLKLEAL